MARPLRIELTEALYQVTAGAIGAYSYAIIVAHVGIHLSTRGRIACASMQQCEN